jgi:hypothetical protein
MRFRAFIVVIVSSLFWLLGWIITPTALALTQIQLFNLSYKDCSAEFAEGNVTSGGSSDPANCFMVMGKAKNPSGKTVYDADVFGRIYDANGEPILQNRGRIGSISEIPAGVSDFEVRISVPANQPTPLKLEQFKASGFAGTVSPNIQQLN